MKTFGAILSLVILVSIAAYVSAEDMKGADSKAPASKPATTTTAPATQKAANGAINQFCAIEKDNKIDPNGKTYTYNGKVIGFCCDDCIDEFKKNPEKYMATLK
jgi:YHS domain-containing protein